MSLRLRASLALFAVGFAVEALGAVYVGFHAATLGAGPAGLFAAGGLLPLAGLALLWLGRHEWAASGGHRTGGSFAGAVGCLALATTPAVAQVADPALALPPWTPWAVAGLIALGILLVYLAYGLAASGFVGPAGRALAASAVLWAGGVGVAVGLAVAPHLPTLARSLARGGYPPGLLPAGAVQLVGYFVVSDLLLLGAFLEALVRSTARASRPRHAGTTS